MTDIYHISAVKCINQDRDFTWLRFPIARWPGCSLYSLNQELNTTATYVFEEDIK